MVQIWRLIDSGVIDGVTSQAIDEAVFEARVKEKVPNTLHLYRRDPPAVSIGKFQKLEEVVNLEYCRQQGIDILRRISGGREVYTDLNCLEYAVIVHQDGQEIPSDIEESFKVICGGIVLALGKLDIEATYKPINDVLVAKRKISGNAQRRRGIILLQHGTLLVDADFESMSKTLKIGDGGKSELMQKLTTIRIETDRPFTFEGVKKAVITGFEETLSMNCLQSTLTPWEEKKVEELVKRYRDEAWIFSARQSW